MRCACCHNIWRHNGGCSDQNTLNPWGNLVQQWLPEWIKHRFEPYPWLMFIRVSVDSTGRRRREAVLERGPDCG